MDWVKLEKISPYNRKTKKLASILGLSRYSAHGLMTCLWCWAIGNAQTGDIIGVDEDTLEDILFWDGEPGKLIMALLDVGLIEKIDGGFRIHGWKDRYNKTLNLDRQDKFRKSRRESNSVTERNALSRSVTERNALSHRIEENRIEEKENRIEEKENRDVSSPAFAGDSPSDSPAGEVEGDGSVFSSDLFSKAQMEKSGDSLLCKKDIKYKDDILAVFEHYRRYHKRAHKSPNSKMKEWRLIRERLESGRTLFDLIDAIDGCHHSDFHMGRNEQGKKYQSLELIMRDDSQVQKFIEIIDPPKEFNPDAIKRS